MKDFIKGLFVAALVAGLCKLSYNKGGHDTINEVKKLAYFKDEVLKYANKES